VMALASYFVIHAFWTDGGQGWAATGVGVASAPITANGVFFANLIGLATGVAVGLITSYYCSMAKAPVDGIVEQSKTGPATNIIAGLAVGMQSTAVPMILIAIGVIGANHFAGLYGVGLAALGMLSTTGIQLAVDAYGPIADNA